MLPNGNKRRNLMQHKILYYRSLPSVTFIVQMVDGRPIIEWCLVFKCQGHLITRQDVQIYGKNNLEVLP